MLNLKSKFNFIFHNRFSPGSCDISNVIVSALGSSWKCPTAWLPASLLCMLQWRLSLWRWLKIWGSFSSWTHQTSKCDPAALQAIRRRHQPGGCWCKVSSPLLAHAVRAQGTGSTHCLCPQGHQVPKQQLQAVSSLLMEAAEARS